MKKGKHELRTRLTIHPEFLPLVPDPHKLKRRQLLRFAEEEGLMLTSQDKDEGRTLEEIAARSLTHRRENTFKKNIGNFYLHLMAALYGGKILRENSSLFNGDYGWQCSFKGFKPDIVVDGDLKTTFIEVKATSGRSVKARFSHSQFLGYSQALLENNGSEMFAGIFKYGPREPQKLYICHNEDGHHCNSRCLADNLSKMTRSLLVIPHNLLTFLLMLSDSTEMDHTSSTGRDYENYKVVLGSNLTLLQEHWENPSQAIDEILANAKKRYFCLGDFEKDNFYLEDIKASQRVGQVVYCRNRRIGDVVYTKKEGEIVSEETKPIVVTEYRAPSFDSWKTFFREEQRRFISSLRMVPEYENMCERRERNQERESMMQEPDMVISPYDSKDKIPF